MKNNPTILQFGALIILVVGLILGAKSYSKTRPEAQSMNDIVTISTEKGDIKIEMYEADAPKTTKNFTEHAKSGYYNKLTFHRVEPGFVIQGGDPKGDGTGGESIYGETFADELNLLAESYKRGYKKGTVAMANRGPNTNGSQFFIMLEDNDTLPKNYTIFGHVIEGQDVVDKIAVGDVMKTVTVEEK